MHEQKPRVWLPGASLLPDSSTQRQIGVSLSFETAALPHQNPSPPHNPTTSQTAQVENLHENSSMIIGEKQPHLERGKIEFVPSVINALILFSIIFLDESSSSGSGNNIVQPASAKGANLALTKTKEFMKVCECRTFNETQLARFFELAQDDEVDVNYVDEEGLAPILVLCWKQRSGSHLLKCLETLLSRKEILVNVQELNQWSNALTIVCQYHGGDKLIHIIHLLLKHKINVDTKNKNNEIAIMALCKNYKEENIKAILHLLLKQAALLKNLNATCKMHGWNALVYLCAKHKGKNLHDAARFLLENGIQVNTELNKSDNALVAACLHQKHQNLIDVVRLLISFKIDVNWTNPVSGENAIIALCRNYCNSNLIDIIKGIVIYT